MVQKSRRNIRRASKQAGEKDPWRQWTGLQNRAAGRAFEEALDRTFDWYTEKGRASVKKTPEPMRVLRSLGDGQFVVCFEKKAQPDYKGTLKGGRSVLLEAKYTSKDKLKQSAVSQEQSEYMQENYILGAACFVVIGFPSGRIYRLPWELWRDMKVWFGRLYVTESDPLAKKYQLNPGPGGILPILEQIDEEGDPSANEV